jgi:uncharacterized repeat protein (TIGR01451 family)
VQRPLLLALALLVASPVTAAAAECPSISGFVYHDRNNNGLRGSAENPIANVSLSLVNAAGVVIATTVTDAKGAYSFSTDASIPTGATTLTQNLSFPELATNVAQTGTIAQFNPRLGDLTTVDVITSGALTSQIRVENVGSSSNNILGEVSGALTLEAPAFGPVVTNVLAQTQQRPFPVYDGTLDYGGTSGFDFGATTASGSSSVSSGVPAVLAAYTGTGTVLFSQRANATSRAIDTAGNVAQIIQTNGRADVTVVYRYVASGCIATGTYTITEVQPPNWEDGRETAGNVVPLPNSVGRDEITITLGDSPLKELNFGELLSSQTPAGGPSGPPTTIAVVKGASRATVTAGKDVAFTIRFRVPGTASALNVKVCDRLPDGMTYVAAPGARFEKGNACWTRAQVQPGTVLTFIVRARVDRDQPGGVLINRVVGTASNAPTVREQASVRVRNPGTTRGRGVPVTG